MNKEAILDLYVEAYKYYNYPPAMGRLLGFFFISNQKYFTFEELIKELGLSKSATSKALKQLIELGEISSKLVKGSKRKRVFYIDPESFINHLQALVDARHLENELYKETLALRNDENPELNEFLEKFINFNNEALQIVEDKLKATFPYVLSKKNVDIN